MLHPSENPTARFAKATMGVANAFNGRLDTLLAPVQGYPMLARCIPPAFYAGCGFVIISKLLA